MISYINLYDFGIVVTMAENTSLKDNVLTIPISTFIFS